MFTHGDQDDIVYQIKKNKKFKKSVKILECKISARGRNILLGSTNV